MIANDPQGSSLTRPVGTRFTEGIQVLELGGDKPGTIDRVEFVGDQAVKLLGAWVLPPSRAIGAVQFLQDWPPKADFGVDLSRAVPAEGTRISPQSEDSASWELLLGVEVTQEGHWTHTAIRVTYEVDGDRYRVDLPTELTVCTDVKFEVDGHCPTMS